MSMSTHIVGIRPADEKYHQMFRVLQTCREAGCNPPSEVVEFFDHDLDEEEPDPLGVTVVLDRGDGVSRYQDHDRPKEGYEVDLRKLDPTIKILRFYNSW